MTTTEAVKKEKKVNVIVIARGCRYNKTDKKGNITAVDPNPGDMITLPLKNARIEKQTGNIRFLFKSEKEVLKKRKVKRNK